MHREVQGVAEVLTDGTTGRRNCGIGPTAKGKNNEESRLSVMVFEARRGGFNGGNGFEEGWSSSWVPPFIGRGRGMSGRGKEASASECAPSQFPLQDGSGTREGR
jgi:hypothetical protein